MKTSTLFNQETKFENSALNKFYNNALINDEMFNVRGGTSDDDDEGVTKNQQDDGFN